jgi:hypothetical protein
MIRLRPAALALLLPFAIACGGSSSSPATTPGGSSRDGDADGDGDVKETVKIERLPDGSIKKTTTRTTRRVVPAAPPPPRPADPFPGDPLVKYNVDRVNAYRAKGGLAPLLYDAPISRFALAGSEQLARDHTPHAHFAASGKGAPGFGSKAAENQGDPGGVPPLGASAAGDRTKIGQQQIDLMLKLMMDEGPGGGHYDNIMNPGYRRVGIGLAYVDGRLYLTNDFSD